MPGVVAGKVKGVEARCGVTAVHWLRAEGVVEELYDVVAIPGVQRPTALGFKIDEIRRTLTLSEASAPAR
ncbi:MAG: hypothetical protein ABL967_19055 [Bryobacteraceae bacterium]